MTGQSRVAAKLNAACASPSLAAPSPKYTTTQFPVFALFKAYADPTAEISQTHWFNPPQHDVPQLSLHFYIIFELVTSLERYCKSIFHVGVFKNQFLPPPCIYSPYLLSSAFSRSVAAKQLWWKGVFCCPFFVSCTFFYNSAHQIGIVGFALAKFYVLGCK